MNFFEKYKGIVSIVALLVIATGGLRLVRSLRRPPETDVIRAYYDEVADEVRVVATYLEKGARVVVLTFDAEARSVNNEPLRRMVAALKEEGLSIRHKERLVMDLAKGWSDTTPGFPYKEFLRVARDHREVDAVISLCGAPYFTAAGDRPDPTTLPPLLIPRGVQWTANLSGLLDEGQVALVVVHEPEQSTDSPDGQALVQTSPRWDLRVP